MGFCRTHQPLRHVACWSLEPPQPRDLGARLVARGFEWGWQPHWMALDLERLRVDHPVPPDLRIEPVEDEGRWNVEDLPYYYRTGAARMQALRQARPQRVWHFAAWLDGRVVGQSVMFLSTGRLGVAGIYSCGVVPSVRGQGIGTAVTGAACRQARAVGCRWALLNATGMGEPVYRRLGFESLGYGQTWWLHRHVLEAPPPTQMQIALAEAVGRGDIAALEALAPRLSPAELDAPLPAGVTPMQLAVTTRQPRSAQWLERQGAALDVISAWDLGWKERVPELLARSPELVNRRSGGWGATPLHTAAERGDAELARVLLAAHPDLEIQDTQFHSTPLGWARHLKRVEIVALIEQHQSRQPMP
jgi:predicted N-acetyltransferase YhbS